MGELYGLALEAFMPIDEGLNGGKTKLLNLGYIRGKL